MNILTNCNGCVFSEMENNVQAGCKLNRHQKFECSIGDNGYFNINRFCNTFRPNEWLSDLSVSESEDIVSTVLDEVKPRVGFFVIFDHDISNLNSTLDDIANQTIDSRYVIVINDKVEYNDDIHSLLLKKFDFDKTNYHIVQIVEQPKIMPMLIDESFKHAKNGWAYVCHSGEPIDRNLIEKIHHRINIDMRRLVFIEPYDDNLNGLFFQTALFKFLNGNHTKVFSDEVVDNRVFIDKVKEACGNSDKDTFTSWEEFNES